MAGMADGGPNICQVDLQLVCENWPLDLLATDEFAKVVLNAI
jgi:hypothetical protein